MLSLQVKLPTTTLAAMPLCSRILGCRSYVLVECIHTVQVVRIKLPPRTNWNVLIINVPVQHIKHGTTHLIGRINRTVRTHRQSFGLIIDHVVHTAHSAIVHRYPFRLCYSIPHRCRKRKHNPKAISYCYRSSHRVPWRNIFGPWPCYRPVRVAAI